MEKSNNNNKGHIFFVCFLSLINNDTLNQKQVAEKIGVTPQQISYWINHSHLPDINAIIKIAEAYNVSTDYLLGRTEYVSDDKDFVFACEKLRMPEEIAKKWLSLGDGINSKTIINVLDWHRSIEYKNIIKIKEMQLLRKLFENKLICDFCKKYGIDLKLSELGCPLDENGKEMDAMRFMEWLESSAVYEDYSPFFQIALLKLDHLFRKFGFCHYDKDFDKDYYDYKCLKATQSFSKELVFSIMIDNDSELYNNCQSLINQLFHFVYDVNSNFYTNFDTELSQEQAEELGGICHSFRYDQQRRYR